MNQHVPIPQAAPVAPVAPAPAEAADKWPWLPKGQPIELNEAEFERWRVATREIHTIAQREGWSKSEIARRADMPMGTFSQWYDGSYSGSYVAQTAKARRWLDTEEERREASRAAIREPGFVETRTAQDVRNALLYAQTLPGMVLVALGPGMGKTTVARHFAETRPHCYRVVMRETTRTVSAMMREVAAKVGVVNGHLPNLDVQIGERVRRNGKQPLLIIDEAQNLDDRAVNQLRYFRDEYGCGIALLGNEDIHTRWGRTEPREGYGQLHRRIDMRMRRLKPLREDIDLFVDAWGIADAEVVKLLRTIGTKPGALGQVTNTIKLAAIAAAGADRAITAADVRWAWSNRSGEDVR